MSKLVQSIVSPRSYRALVVSSIALAAFALGRGGSRVIPAVVPITTPPIIIPSAEITIAPAPVVIAPAPPPPDEEIPEPAASPRPRALTPSLDAACVFPPAEGEVAESSTTCTWDDGFPAISADGTLVATKYSPPSGQSGLYGLSIHVIEMKTSRVVRELLILKQDESSSFVYPEDGVSQQVQQRIRKLVSSRMAKATAALDARQFRSMIALGGFSSNAGGEPTPAGPPPVDAPYAELVGSAARIVDPVTNTVLWRGDLGVASDRTRDPDAECGGWSLWGMVVAWDPSTKVVHASSSYRTGGCMCPDEPMERVLTIP